MEVGAPAISSPSFGDTFGEQTQVVEQAFVEENENLIWVNGRYKGYVSLYISEEYIDVSFKYVSTVKSKDYRTVKPSVFRVEHSKPFLS